MQITQSTCCLSDHAGELCRLRAVGLEEGAGGDVKAQAAQLLADGRLPPQHLQRQLTEK
jgi:hypothetical protein